MKARPFYLSLMCIAVAALLGAAIRVPAQTGPNFIGPAPSPALSAWQAYQQVGQFLAASTQPAPVSYLPAGPKDFLGANDEVNNGTGICRWANVANDFSGFYDASGGRLPFAWSIHGYPVASGCQVSAWCWMNGCKAGDYQLSCTGNVAFSVSVDGGTYTATDANHGVIHLPTDGTLGPNAWGPMNPTHQVVITVTRSDPAAPMDDLEIWAAGYGPGTPKAGQLYDDRYLSLFRNVACVRVMGSLNTNNSPETDWGTRVPEDVWDQTSRGVSHGREIELAREAKIPRLWISLPSNSTPDYWAQCAKFYHDNLPPNVLLIVELGNENWNWTIGRHPYRFAADQVAQAVEATLNGFGQPASNGDPNIRDPRYVAERARQCALVFQQAFADRPQCLANVFAGSAADSRWIDFGLGWLTARYGGHPFQLVAIAPYWDYWWNGGYFFQSTGGSTTQPVPTLQDCFDAVGRFLADNTGKGNGLQYQLAQGQALAAKYHAILVDYEGGESEIPGPQFLLPDKSLDPSGLPTLMQTDPRLEITTDQYYAGLHHGRVAMHCEFCLIGDPWSQYGYWSLLRNYGDMTPRWNAFQRELFRNN